MNDEELLTIRDIVSEFGVNEKTVRRWIQSGELKATRDIVGRYRISRVALEDFRQRRMKKYTDGDGQ